MPTKRKYPDPDFGARFGKLTVVANPYTIHSTYTLNRTRQVQCVCDCGNTAYPTVKKLYDGQATSCGCDKKRHAVVPPIGTQYGKLTVIEPDPYELDEKGELRDMHGNRAVMVRCSCKDETVFVANIYLLRDSKIQSCGCLRKNSLRNLAAGKRGKEHPAWRSYDEFKGKKVGCRSMLTYIEEVESTTNNRGNTVRMGLFRCDCGAEVTRQLSATINQRTRSCGQCTDAPYK